MIRRPPRSTLSPTRRSSDLTVAGYQLTCCGDRGPFTYKLSRRGDSLADRKSTRLNSSHSQISYSIFFFNDTATTEIYTFPYTTLFRSDGGRVPTDLLRRSRPLHLQAVTTRRLARRSEEHTSELQSQSNLLFHLFF